MNGDAVYGWQALSIAGVNTYILLLSHFPALVIAPALTYGRPIAREKPKIIIVGRGSALIY